MAVAGPSVADEKLNLVLLFDASLSVSKVMAPFVWDGSRDQSGMPKFSGTRPPNEPPDLFVRPCRDALATLTRDDRVRIGTFAAAIRLSDTFPGGVAAAKSVGDLLRVPSDERSGPSRVWDAIDEAVAKLETGPGRRVVVLVTDGRASGNRKGLKQVVQRATTTRTSVSVIEVRPGAANFGPTFALTDSTRGPWVVLTNPLGPPPEVTLGNLALATDGFHEIDDSGGNRRLGPLMAAIIDRMRR